MNALHSPGAEFVGSGFSSLSALITGARCSSAS